MLVVFFFEDIMNLRDDLVTIEAVGDAQPEPVQEGVREPAADVVREGAIGHDVWHVAEIELDVMQGGHEGFHRFAALLKVRCVDGGVFRLAVVIKLPQFAGL